MNIQNAAGALLIILPLAFNLFYFLLGRRFDYPNILRSPTEEVLSRRTDQRASPWNCTTSARTSTTAAVGTMARL